MSKVDVVLNRLLFYFLLFLFFLKNTIFINSSYFNIGFAGIILVFMGLYIITYKIYNLKTSNIIFLTLFGLLLFQGFILTYHLKFSYYKYFYDIARYLSFIGIFIFGKYAFNNISSKGIAIWYLLIILYHVITGYFILFFGELTIMHENIRLSGGFENIGQFGLLMGLSTIILLILFKYSKDLLYRIIFTILIILTVVLLSFNNTMRAFVALMFGFFMYYIFYKKKFLYFFIICLFVFAFIFTNKELFHKLSSILTSSYDISGLNNGGMENSFQWRVAQWYLLITDWFHNYLFMGVGLGQQTVLHGFITPWGEPFVAHSDFVKLLVETGLIGFTIVLILYFQLYKFIKNNSYPEEFMIIFMYFLFCLLTGNTLFSDPFQIFVFMIGFMTMVKPVDKVTNKLENQVKEYI